MTLNFKMTQKDFESGMKLHAKQQAKNIWVFILFMSVTYFLVNTIFESARSIITDVITAVLFFTIFGLLIYFSQKFHSKKQYNTNLVYQDELHYTFNDEGIHIIHSLGNSFEKWDGLRNYKESESTYLIYLSPYLMYVLPKRVMNEEEKNKLKFYLETYLLN